MFEKDLRPELNSRRGEGTAWVLTAIVTLAMGVLILQVGKIPVAAWVFWGFLFFAAFSISLGNWMDRKTLLRVGVDGIAFENGLRKVALIWPEVEKVNVLPLRWGRSVQVISSGSHFEFRTLGKVQYQGEVRGRLGFAEGQAVLDEILKSTDLVLKKEENGSYYYSRS